MIRLCTFETAANLYGRRRQANNFYAVMAAKRFQARTEEEIEQLLRDKSSKATDRFATYFICKLLGFVTSCNTPHGRSTTVSLETYPL